MAQNSNEAIRSTSVQPAIAGTSSASVPIYNAALSDADNAFTTPSREALYVLFGYQVYKGC